MCDNTVINMLVISNFKFNSACVTKFITRNRIFWNKNVFVANTYFYLSFILAAGPGMSLF